MMNKGSLEVLVFTGSHSPRRVVRRPEQGILNDGREHSLRIDRLPGRFVCLFSLCLCSYLCNITFYCLLLCIISLMFFVCLSLWVFSTRSFAVQVDEEAKREAALPNDQPVSLQRVFLGGIPAEVEQTSNRANIPFQGCIWNLMVNAMYVTFSVCVYMQQMSMY